MINTEFGQKIGAWAFIVGIVVALVVSLIISFGGQMYDWVIPLMLVLGIIVGLFNITSGETKLYLIAAIAFLLSFTSLNAAAALLPNVLAEPTIQFFSMMVAFVAASTAIVAIQTLFFLAKTSRGRV